MWNALGMLKTISGSFSESEKTKASLMATRQLWVSWLVFLCRDARTVNSRFGLGVVVTFVLKRMPIVCFLYPCLCGPLSLKNLLQRALSNQSTQAGFFNQSGAKPGPIVTFFPRFVSTARFPALSIGCMFSRAWYQLLVFPRLATVTIFPALVIGCITGGTCSRARFPALDIGYLFSRA